LPGRGFDIGRMIATTASPMFFRSGLVVSDNGEGFHDKNMESFKTLDSEYKSAQDQIGEWDGRLWS
jgi:hypothetical protein